MTGLGQLPRANRMRGVTPYRRRLRTPAGRGAATIEFLIGAVLLVPMFGALVLLGRVHDIGQSAVQASRFAAFDRALVPERNASDPAQRVRDRFFTTDPHWRNLRGQALLGADIDRTVGVRIERLPAGAADQVQDALGGFFGLSTEGPARVTVGATLRPFAGLTGYAPLDDVEIALTAATAVATGSWSAAGTDDVAARVSKTVLSAPLAQVNDIIAVALMPFEKGPGPQFGCVAADVVPSDRLQRAAPLKFCER